MSGEGHQEVIIEYTKMVLEHNDTLLKLVGGLIVFNLVLYANLTNPRRRLDSVETSSRAEAVTPIPSKPSWWMLASSVTGVLAIFFGYLSNLTLLSHMADWADGTIENWAAAPQSELFSGIQICCMFACLFCVIMVVIVHRSAAIEALSKTRLGGGE